MPAPNVAEYTHKIDMMVKGKYISVSELADFLGCSKPTVARMIKRGLFSAIQLSGNKWWIDKEEAAAYIAKKRREAVQQAKRARGLSELREELYTQA